MFQANRPRRSGAATVEVVERLRRSAARVVAASGLILWIGMGGVAAAQTAPTVTTQTPSSVSSTSAVLGGRVTDQGDATVTGRGVVYSTTNTSPIVGGPGTTTAPNGSGIGSFSATVVGLNPATTYHVRAYATNAGGTGYGSVTSFRTEVPPLQTSASQTNIACNGGTTGRAAIVPSGGTAPYSYLWNDGRTTNEIVGLAAGSYSVTVTDSSQSQRSAQRTFTITQPPAIAATASATNASAGTNDGTATVSVSGGTPGYTFRWTNGATTSNISGLAPGTYTVTVTDANGCPQQASTTVARTAPTLTLSPPDGRLPNGTAGVAYSVAFRADGGTAPYAYSLASGSPPPGMTLDGSGRLSGTPTASGSFSFEIRATDASPAPGPYFITQNYSLTVAPGPITITPTSIPAGQSGTAYSQTLTASGGTAPYTYAVVAGALPGGVTLAVNGTLSGRPTTPGVFFFTVRVTETSSAPRTVTQGYTLTVGAAPPPPPAPIPTMSEWAMILLGLLMAAGTVWTLHRRTVEA